MLADQDEWMNHRAHPKNTKRWCRGIVGREHVTQLLIPANASSRFCSVYDDGEYREKYLWEIGCSHVEQCIDCGKHVRPFLNRGECPSRLPPVTRD